MKYPDRVKQAVTGSTASLTLGAAIPPYRTVAAALADGDVAVGSRVSVCVEDSAGNWQESYYTVDDSTQLTLESVHRSSGTVTFPATAFCTVFGKDLVVTRDIAFSTSVPLTHPGQAYMPQQTVSGSLAFTPAAAAVRGALVYLRLVANGANSPTFTGFKEWGGSLGYDNRNGIVNQVQFFCDGVDCWYSVSQAAGAAPADVTSPTASSAAVANASPTVVAIIMSEALDPAHVPAASAFTVSGHTVSSVAFSGSAVNLTVTPAFVNGEAARTVGYTQPGANNARDASGNLLANFASLSIVNNVQPVDSTAPTVSSAQVADAAPAQIAITMSEAMANSVPAASAFTASGKTVNSVTVSGTTVTLTLDSAYVNGDVINVSYTQPGVNPRLQDGVGNATSSFGPFLVTNNVGAAAVPARLTQLSRMTESGTGPNYSYAGDGSNFFVTTPFGPGGVVDKVLASGADGSISAQASIITSGGAPILGLTTQSTLVSYTSLAYGVFGDGTNGIYKIIANGTIAAASTAVAPQANDHIRMRRAGSSIIVEIARSATPTAWVTVHTFTGANTGTLYGQMMVALATVLSNITTVGMT